MLARPATSVDTFDERRALRARSAQSGVVAEQLRQAALDHYDDVCSDGQSVPGLGTSRLVEVVRVPTLDRPSRQPGEIECDEVVHIVWREQPAEAIEVVPLRRIDVMTGEQGLDRLLPRLMSPHAGAPSDQLVFANACSPSDRSSRAQRSHRHAARRTSGRSLKLPALAQRDTYDSWRPRLNGEPLFVGHDHVDRDGEIRHLTQYSHGIVMAVRDVVQHHHEVNVGVRAGLAPSDRTEQQDSPSTTPLEDALGDLRQPGREIPPIVIDNGASHKAILAPADAP